MNPNPSKSKPNRHLNQILAAISLLALGAMLPTSAFAGPNGGAGVLKNGELMTFHSAGFFARPAPTALEIPGMDELIDYLGSQHGIPRSIADRIVAAALPSPQHAYFAVQEEQFDEATRKRLIAEFKRVIGSRQANIQLFAITDTRTRTTYLLPAYFKLSTREQMAILVHEAHWIFNPNASYADVVTTENQFQTLLDQPGDAHALMDILKSFGARSSLLDALALKSDLARGALDALIQETDGHRTIRMIDLFGEGYLRCTIGLDDDADGKICEQEFYRHLYSLKKQAPNSLWLKRVTQSVKAGGKYRVLGDGEVSGFYQFEMNDQGQYVPTNHGKRPGATAAPVKFGSFRMPQIPRICLARQAAFPHQPNGGFDDERMTWKPMMKRGFHVTPLLTLDRMSSYLRVPSSVDLDAPLAGIPLVFPSRLEWRFEGGYYAWQSDYPNRWRFIPSNPCEPMTYPSELYERRFAASQDL